MKNRVFFWKSAQAIACGLLITLPGCASKAPKDAAKQLPVKENELKQLYNAQKCEGSPICGRHAVLYIPRDKNNQPLTDPETGDYKCMAFITPPNDKGGSIQRQHQMYVFAADATLSELKDNIPVSEIPFSNVKDAKAFHDELVKLADAVKSQLNQESATGEINTKTYYSMANITAGLGDLMHEIQEISPLKEPSLNQLQRAIKELKTSTL